MGWVGMHVGFCNDTSGVDMCRYVRVNREHRHSVLCMSHHIHTRTQSPPTHIHKLSSCIQHTLHTCMQLKRTKWCSFVFFTMVKNTRKNMTRGAN